MRQSFVAKVLQRLDGEDPLRATRVTAHKDKVSIFGRLIIPFQEMFQLGRFTILTKECGSGLGSPHQSHVGVFLVSIKVILRSAKQRHDVASQTGFIERFFLDRRDHCPALFGGFFCVRGFGDLLVDSIGHVLDRDQLIQFQIRCLEFLVKALRQKPIVDQIAFFGTKLGQRVAGNMVVGQHQTVGGHKRSGTTGVKPNRRELQMLQPFFGRFELMSVSQQFARNIVEQIHAFISMRIAGQTSQSENHATSRQEPTAHVCKHDG